uniref:Uncharacterized protein n=1 Tax=Hyaloperonospora arabidopsidis (strain Emoy2) TaxID=559515 RepID=M4C0Q0_HYAAE
MTRQDAAVSRLLVLSSDMESSHSVVEKLLKLCANFTTEVASSSNEVVLTLQTKYYRARVKVHLHVVLDSEPEPELQHELQDYEAVIVVVDALQNGSFLHVRGLAKRIVETTSCDVCLLLVTSTLREAPECVQQMEIWCQDNGFEIVMLDGAENLGGDDSVMTEKHGIERVLEALQCNRWRSMEMEGRDLVGKTGVEVAADGVEMSVDDKDMMEGRAENKEEHKGGQWDGREDLRRHETRLQQALEVVERSCASSEKMEGDGIENDDIDMDDFSALIAQVRNIRDQFGILDDTERRERAAEVAMKLSEFLGGNDDTLDDTSSVHL